MSRIVIPFSGGVNSTYALWRWLSHTSDDIVAVYAEETWQDQLVEQGREERERVAADAIAAWLSDNVRNFTYEVTQWPFDYTAKQAPIREGFAATVDIGILEPRYAGYKSLVDEHTPDGIVLGVCLENTATDNHDNLRGIFETDGVDVFLAGCPTLDPVATGAAFDYDAVAATMIGRFQQYEELPDAVVDLIAAKTSTHPDPQATDGSAVANMSCLYEDVRAARTDMTGAEIDAAFGEHGKYGQWRHLADPLTYTYRGNPQQKALELLDISLGDPT